MKINKFIDENLDDACWDDYEAIGFKMKNGKRVPNCVPEKESTFKRYRSIYKEEQFQLRDIDAEKTYQMFSSNYLKTTGKTWSYDKFISQSYNYVFFGDDKGYLMVKPQASGMYKLIGSAGDFRSVIKGIKELTALGKPVWGMASKELVSLGSRFGFINPPAWFVKILLKQIPKGVLSGSSNDFKVNNDGSITLNYPDVGEATKYFFANKEYYLWLLNNFSQMFSNSVSKVLGGIISSGKSFFRNVPLLKSLFIKEGYKFKKRKLY